MERFTQMKILQKHAKYLEITSWICNNDLSAFLRCFMCEDLSDGAPTPFEDRSFCFSLMVIIYRMFVLFFVGKLTFLKI